MICLFVSVYSTSLPVAHLSDAPRKRLAVTGDIARIQDETNENSVWFFNVLDVKHIHKGPRFKVSSERQVIIGCPARESNPQTLVLSRALEPLSYSGGWLVELVLYCIVLLIEIKEKTK